MTRAEKRLLLRVARENEILLGVLEDIAYGTRTHARIAARRGLEKISKASQTKYGRTSLSFGPEPEV